MNHYADIIILAVVSIVLALKLFSVLGQRRERETPNSEESTVGVSDKSTGKLIKDVEVKIDNTMAPELQLPLLDKSFDKGKFIKNAKSAFRIILDAYANGDIHALSKLLNVAMMRKLAYKISQREDKNYSCEINILGINETYITNIVIRDSIAEIDVEFHTEIIHCVTDSKNKVITGDKSKVEKIKDTWTFSRNLKSPDPTWTLTSSNATNLFN